MTSEIAAKAKFSLIRYAQCWEDADILLAAASIEPHHTCLSICSAGDNTLAMVSRGPRRVVALDISPAQIACLEIRVAAFRCLLHPELLELVGASKSTQRPELYQRCREFLSAPVRAFWDARPSAIAQGIGKHGRFERYLRFFARWILPLIHSYARRLSVLTPKSQEERTYFYEQIWNSTRWRLLFRLFFSRRLMGWLGRHPDFFAYVESSVADHLLARVRHALTELDPSANPYIHWILLGGYGTHLPYWLRAENFAAIRDNLDCLQWQTGTLETLLNDSPARQFDCYNLSDIFEYMSLANYHRVLEQLCDKGRIGARLLYWNMLAPRRRPEQLAGRLRSLRELSTQLHLRDKAFFYRDFIVEEVIA